MSLAPGEAAAIDRWLATTPGINEFGDPMTLTYAELPLQVDAAGRVSGLHEYVLRNHPDRPWAPKAAPAPGPAPSARLRRAGDEPAATGTGKTAEVASEAAASEVLPTDAVGATASVDAAGIASAAAESQWHDQLLGMSEMEREVSQLRRRFGASFREMSSTMFQFPFKSTDPDFSFALPPAGITVTLMLTTDYPAMPCKVAVSAEGVAPLALRHVESCVDRFCQTKAGTPMVRPMLKMLDRQLEEMLVAGSEAAAAAAVAPPPAAAPAPQEWYGAGGAAYGEPWECPACTFINEGVAPYCGVCEGPRPAASHYSDGGVAGASAGGDDLYAVPDAPIVETGTGATTVASPTGYPPLDAAREQLDDIEGIIQSACSERTRCGGAIVDPDLVNRLVSSRASMTEINIRLDLLDVSADKTLRLERRRVLHRIDNMERMINELIEGPDAFAGSEVQHDFDEVKLNLPEETGLSESKGGAQERLLGHIADVDVSADVAQGVTADDLRETGNVCFRDGMYEEALSLYKRAAAIDATNINLYTNIAQVLLKLGRWQDTIDVCTVAIEMSEGGSAKAYFRRAKALFELGLIREAMGDTEAALRLEAGDTTMQEFLTKCKNTLAN